MVGHICIVLCIAVTAQLSSAQRPFNLFSSMNGIGGGGAMWGNQNQRRNVNQQNENLQYVTCVATSQSQDQIRVTFTRPQSQSSPQNQFWWMPRRQEQRNWWEPPQPVHMSATVASGQASQFAGPMQMVVTEYGHTEGSCSPMTMGSVIQGFSRNQNQFQPPMMLNQFMNMGQNQNQNQNQNKRGGTIGSGFNLQSGHQVLMSELVYVDFDTLPGRGLGFCMNTNGGTCGFMLPLCCTLGRTRVAVTGNMASGQMQNGGMRGQNGMMGQNPMVNNFQNTNTNNFGNIQNPALNTGTNNGMVFP